MRLGPALIPVKKRETISLKCHVVSGFIYMVADMCADVCDLATTTYKTDYVSLSYRPRANASNRQPDVAALNCGSHH